MYQPEEFYHGFQVNHFDYKQLSNRYLLDLPDGEIENLIVPIPYGAKEEFRRSIKADIRLTFLLCVETLFELIFGLLPDDNNNFHDASLLYRLVERRPNYEEIRKFNKGEPSKLDKLDDLLTFQAGIRGPILRHLFYFGFWKEELEKLVDSSIPVIKRILRILANELSNREELNSYKHGQRGISLIKSLILADPETMSERFRFDMVDSITIFSQNKKSGVQEFLTKNYDPERDIALTHKASSLISNIIQPRKSLLPDRIPKEQGIPILFFDDDDLHRASKVNVQIQDFKFTLSPDN